MTNDIEDDFKDGLEDGLNAEQLPDPNTAEVKRLANKRKHFLKEKIELRKMAEELGLSYEDYVEFLVNK